MGSLSWSRTACSLQPQCPAWNELPGAIYFMLRLQPPGKIVCNTAQICSYCSFQRHPIKEIPYHFCSCKPVSNSHVLSVSDILPKSLLLREVFLFCSQGEMEVTKHRPSFEDNCKYLSPYPQLLCLL